ncbi:MAG: ABC transporter permease subunit [Mycobacterium sp.]|nr:ABC transporter permease subunit [Mycobacterium sp.]
MSQARSPASWRTLLWALPAVLPVVTVLGAGLGSALLQSLGLMPLVGAPTLTLNAYGGNVDDIATSAALSIAIAAVATSLAVLIGVTAALTALAGHRSALWAGTVTVPIPHLIGAATMGLLLADSGLLARLFGLSEGGWPALVGGRWWIAVVLEYTWKESAFIGLVVAAVLATRVAAYEETAAVLGATRWVRLKLVTFPLIGPAVLAAATISFTYTLGSYEVARLLGRAYPEPLPVMAVRLFTSIDLATRPQAAAAGTITAALALLAVAAALMVLRRSAVWR